LLKTPLTSRKRVSQVQEVYRTPTHHDQKRKTLRLILIKTVSTQNKERKKRKDTSHIKANPLEYQQVSKLNL
jgi:hypothetical protein